MVALAELLKQAINLPKEQPKRKRILQGDDAPIKTTSGQVNKKRKREEEKKKKTEEELEEISNPRIIAPRKIQRILSYHHAITSLGPSTQESVANVDKEIWHYLQKELFHRNPISRLRSIELTHQLAVALPLFRATLADDLQLIARSGGLLPSLSLSVKTKEMVKGTNTEKKLIEDCVKEKIEIWDQLFGNELEKFHSMRRYFTESLKLAMPNLEEKARQVLIAETDRQRIERRKTLIRGEQIVKKGLLDETMQSVKLAIQSIEECFGILFPGIDQDLPLSSTKIDNAPEIGEDVAQDIDWDLIEWVDGDEDTDQDDEDNFEYEGIPTSHTLPYTIEFELSTNVAELCSADNKDVLAVIRENVAHLTKFELPKLMEWRQIFSEIVTILEKDIIDHQTGNISNSSDVQNCSSNFVSQHNVVSIVQANGLLSRTKRALLEIQALIDETHNLLTHRCKELLV